ncbi:MAG: hypothetical protein NVSMB5_27310 [Candidatus Velthaea sp.]
MRAARTAALVGLVTLTGVGWGLLAPFSKLFFQDDPAVFNGMTLAVARAVWALPLFVFMLALSWRLERPSFSRRTALAFGGLGLGFVGFFVLFSVASQHTSVAHIAFLSGLAPPINAAFAALVFRTRLDAVRCIALAIGVAGVGLLALTKASDGSSIAGDALMIAWLLNFAVYATLLRTVSARYGIVFITAMTGTLATLVLTIAGVALGAGGAIAHVYDSPLLGAAFFAEIVVLSAVISPLAFATSIRRTGVAIATSGAQYMAVGVGILSSLLVLHEHWQPLLPVAGALLLASLALTFAPAGLFKSRPKSSRRRYASDVPERGP